MSTQQSQPTNATSSAFSLLAGIDLSSIDPRLAQRMVAAQLPLLSRQCADIQALITDSESHFLEGFIEAQKDAATATLVQAAAGAGGEAIVGGASGYQAVKSAKNAEAIKAFQGEIDGKLAELKSGEATQQLTARAPSPIQNVNNLPDGQTILATKVPKASVAPTTQEAAGILQRRTRDEILNESRTRLAEMEANNTSDSSKGQAGQSTGRLLQEGLSKTADSTKQIHDMEGQQMNQAYTVQTEANKTVNDTQGKAASINPYEANASLRA